MRGFFLPSRGVQVAIVGPEDRTESFVREQRANVAVVFKEGVRICFSTGTVGATLVANAFGMSPAVNVGTMSRLFATKVAPTAGPSVLFDFAPTDLSIGIATRHLNYRE